jgi:hypothetical protein
MQGLAAVAAPATGCDSIGKASQPSLQISSNGATAGKCLSLCACIVGSTLAGLCTVAQHIQARQGPLIQNTRSHTDRSAGGRRSRQGRPPCRVSPGCNCDSAWDGSAVSVEYFGCYEWRRGYSGSGLWLLATAVVPVFGFRRNDGRYDEAICLHAPGTDTAQPTMAAVTSEIPEDRRGLKNDPLPPHLAWACNLVSIVAETAHQQTHQRTHQAGSHPIRCDLAGGSHGPVRVSFRVCASTAVLRRI